MDKTVPARTAVLLEFIYETETSQAPPARNEVNFGNRQIALTKALTRMTWPRCWPSSGSGARRSGRRSRFRQDAVGGGRATVHAQDPARLRSGSLGTIKAGSPMITCRIGSPAICSRRKRPQNAPVWPGGPAHSSEGSQAKVRSAESREIWNVMVLSSWIVEVTGGRRRFSATPWFQDLQAIVGQSNSLAYLNREFHAADRGYPTP